MLDLTDPKYKPLTPEEELELIKRVKNGDKQARKELCERNLRYIYKLAVKYKRPEVEIDELINAGVIGLYEALDKFDIKQNKRFLTYAHWKIFEHIFAHANAYISQLYLPPNKKKELLAIYKVVPDLEMKLGREPTPEEVYKELKRQRYKNIPLSFVKFVMNKQHIPLLDEETNPGEYPEEND